MLHHLLTTLCSLVPMLLKVLAAVLIIAHALAIDSDVFVALSVSYTIPSFIFALCFPMIDGCQAFQSPSLLAVVCMMKAIVIPLLNFASIPVITGVVRKGRSSITAV